MRHLSDAQAKRTALQHDQEDGTELEARYVGTLHCLAASTGTFVGFRPQAKEVQILQTWLYQLRETAVSLLQVFLHFSQSWDACVDMHQVVPLELASQS